jgi:hypothetical protein
MRCHRSLLARDLCQGASELRRPCDTHASEISHAWWHTQTIELQRDCTNMPHIIIATPAPRFLVDRHPLPSFGSKLNRLTYLRCLMYGHNYIFVVLYWFHGRGPNQRRPPGGCTFGQPRKNTKTEQSKPTLNDVKTTNFVADTHHRRQATQVRTLVIEAGTHPRCDAAC